MIETGTYNLIYIMTRMNSVKFTLRAMEAIRKATSCRVTSLLDAFVANNTIEALVDILQGIGDDTLELIDRTAPEKRDAE